MSTPDADSLPEPKGGPTPPGGRGWLLDGALVVAATCLVLGVDLAWMGTRSYTPEADYALHVVEVHSFWSTLREAGNPWQVALLAWIWPGPYPAGVYLLTLPFLALLGPGLQAPLLSELVFVPVFLGSLYALVRPGWGRLAGLAAMLLGAGNPCLLNSSRHYLLDFPLSAVTALGLALLVHGDGFRHRARTLALGLALGGGMLVKFTLAWFLGPALLLAVAEQVPGWLRSSGRSLRNQAILAAVVGTTLLALARLGEGVDPEIFSRGDLLPPRALLLVLGVVLLALGWGWAARRLRAPGPADDALVNLAHAGGLAMAVAGPWFVCNRAVVLARWGAVGHDFPQPLEKLRPFLVDFSLGAPGWPYLAPLLLGLALAFWKGSKPVERWTAAAVLGGTLGTFLVLGVGTRYLAPTQALGTVLAVGALARLPGGSLLALLVGGAAALLNLGLPAFPLPPGREPQVLNPLATLFHSPREGPVRAGDSRFAHAWALGPDLVRNAPGLVAIPLHPGDPTPTHDAWYGLQAWSEGHGRPLVPILVEGEPGGERAHEILPFLRPRTLQTLRRRDPELAACLDPLPPDLALPPGSWSGLVEVLVPGVPSRTREAVERVLGPGVEAQDHPGPGFTLRTWRRKDG